jgi:type VI secretion system protein ImpJ
MQSLAASRLVSLIRELVGLFHQRGDHIAARIGAVGQGISAETVNLLLLQAINSYEPILAHIVRTGVHPEQVFRLLVQAAGELATFTSNARRPPTLPSYQHERLRESFEPVFTTLEAQLNQVLPETAIPIPLERRQFGYWLARVPDRSLFDNAIFVLALRSELTADEVLRRVERQLKLGPPEAIEDIVTRALGGLPASPTQGAPRQIRIRAGFVYFELNRSHELWKQIRTAGAVALFPGEFPGLEMELWAIRT